MTTPVTVAVLAFPEATASVVYGMYDLFMSAGRDWGVVVEGRPGPSFDAASRGIRARGGVPSQQRRAHRAATDSRFVPPSRHRLHFPRSPCRRASPWRDDSFRRSPGCNAAIDLVRLSLRLARCAMLLAEAGLLNGHEATTHWAYCDILRRRYPEVNVQSQRALVVSGEGQRLVMAGAGTSWLDLALYLIARTVGVEVAMQVARINLIDWHAHRAAAFCTSGPIATGGRCHHRALPDLDRGKLPRTCAGSGDGASERSGGTVLQASFSTGNGHVTTRVRAYPAARGGEAPA